MGHERRSGPRLIADAPIFIFVEGKVHKGKLLNVSESAVAFHSPARLAEKERARVAFDVPGTTLSLEAAGEVIWADDEGRVAMRFLDLSNELKSGLRAWIYGSP